MVPDETYQPQYITVIKTVNLGGKLIKYYGSKRNPRYDPSRDRFKRYFNR